MYVHVDMYVRMYLCMYVYMYVSCMYVYVGILHIGTHHTGVSFGNLVSFVTELELVTGTGEVNNICVQVLIITDRQTDKQTERLADRQTDWQTYRQTDRQTNEHV